MVVMLSGWKGSGKDTLASFLVRNYGFKQLSFANILKDMVAEQYGIPRAHLDDPAFKEKPLLQYPVDAKDAFSKKVHEIMCGEFRKHEGKLYHTPRSLAILEGSIKRSVDPSYWVKLVARQIVPRVLTENFVISDWRYKSELEAMQKEGLDPVLIRIERFDSSPSSDASERDLDSFEFQYVINNRGPVEKALAHVSLIVGMYLGNGEASQ